MIVAPRSTSARLALSAAGFMATSTLGASPGVRMSRAAKWIWNDETPASVPAGARISAGKLGSVARSFPSAAVASVNRPPASCIPSPESPANRTMTRSCSLTSFATALTETPLRKADRPLLLTAVVRIPLGPAADGSATAAGAAKRHGRPLERHHLLLLLGLDRVRVRVWARAEELEALGDDPDRLASLALRRLPLAPFQPAVDGHRTSLREEAS